MSKGMDQKKSAKKKPAKSLMEKACGQGREEGPEEVADVLVRFRNRHRVQR